MIFRKILIALLTVATTACAPSAGSNRDASKIKTGGMTSGGGWATTKSQMILDCRVHIDEAAAPRDATLVRAVIVKKWLGALADNPWYEVLVGAAAPEDDLALTSYKTDGTEVEVGIVDEEIDVVAFAMFDLQHKCSAATKAPAVHPDAFGVGLINNCHCHVE